MSPHTLEKNKTHFLSYKFIAVVLVKMYEECTYCYDSIPQNQFKKKLY